MLPVTRVGIPYFIDLPIFRGKGPRPILWDGSRPARGKKITESGIPNCLNYSERFGVCTQFTNVTAGRIIQLGGPGSGLDTHALFVLAQIIFELLLTQ
jgi:hypothetical protein